ncbi:vomeronasal type-1 receptor 4-like [Manis javanica]|uniref:vomeronasal type-1 receptor 4-like n=1 Tax=Manis javanica TaxID=9974 RepID=UPI003C6D2D68
MLMGRIASSELTVGIIFLSQTIIAILGNFSLLCQFLYYRECRVRATDLILKHLTISNSLVVLSKGVPQTMAALGLKHFLGDLACRLLLYAQRVGRGVSIGTTCLLSVFQAVRISPVNSCWKVKFPKYIGSSVSICWILYTFVNLIFPAYVFCVSGQWSSKNMTRKRDLGYCSYVDDEQISGSVYAALIAFPEVSLSGLMLWASGSMVLILHRHKRRVRHIHSTNVSPRSSAESRATQRVLVLGSTFVCFYFLSSVFHAYLIYNPTWWLVNTCSLISVCFPTVSPYLLMSWGSTVPRLCFVWVRNMKSPPLSRRK